MPQLTVYVVVVIGETITVPETAVPVEKAVPTQDAALEESQVRMAEEPFGMVALTADEPLATGRIVDAAERYAVAVPPPVTVKVAFAGAESVPFVHVTV